MRTTTELSGAHLHIIAKSMPRAMEGTAPYNSQKNGATQRNAVFAITKVCSGQSLTAFARRVGGAAELAAREATMTHGFGGMSVLTRTEELSPDLLERVLSGLGLSAIPTPDLNGLSNSRRAIKPSNHRDIRIAFS